MQLAKQIKNAVQDTHVKLTKGLPQQYRPLLESIGNSRFVMLGSQTMGTHEFYQHRAEITKQLIENNGFNAVAVTSDWPDCWHIHRYVSGQGRDQAIVEKEPLHFFKKYPSWVMRNKPMVDFIEWLKSHNESLKVKIHDKEERKHKVVGFYGLDLYSISSAIHEINNYLKKVDPREAKEARHRLSFFFHESRNVLDSASALSDPLVSKQVFRELSKEAARIHNERRRLYRLKGLILDDEEFFNTEMNVKMLQDAERFYHSLYTATMEETWNIRSKHMFDTVRLLDNHLSKKHGTPLKLVVWGHNNHVGRSSATEWGERGETNLCELLRNHYGHDNTYSIGFLTNQGSVLASPGLHKGPIEMPLTPNTHTIENLFHHTGVPAFYLLLHSNNSNSTVQPDKDVKDELKNRETVQRSIGIVYNRENELQENFMKARVGKQFDAVFYLDHTRAVEALNFDEIEQAAGPDDPRTEPFDV